MDLDGDFADAEIGSNLLIQHSRYHHIHHFALAHGQQPVMTSQVYKCTLPLEPYLVAIQSLVDRIQQVMIAEGLGQKLYRARFHSPHRHWNVSVPGDEDDGDVDTRLNQFFLE